MKHKGMIALMYGFCVVPVVVLALTYGRMPDIVPTHFGIDGAPDAYGPKSTMIFLAFLPTLMALMMQFLPKIDPRRQAYVKFQKYYDFFAVFMTVFVTVVFLIATRETLHPGSVSVGRIVTAMVACLFIVIGNMMGKIKHNYLFGIKTPWTLADPDVWVRTHSLGGKIWFIFGILMLPAALLLKEQVFFWLLMAGLLGSVIVLFAASYLFFRKKNREEE